jgi:hypothetical protein
MPYASSNNAVLINGCNNLQNPSVLLEVTEDIATTTGSGWSMQLNSFPPPGQYCQTSQINWLQYIVIVQGGILRYYIQYWALGASTWPSGYTAQPGTAPWLPCWAHDWGTAPTFANITADTLPRESTLQIQLITNGSGVVSVTFTYTDPDGNAHPAVWTAPVVHPIVGFELNFVGAPGGNANFTQGLTNSRGIIYYSVSSGQLSVQSGGPGSACGEYGGAVTGELSNMTYSDINGAPASTVTQILQQPVPCVITSISLTDQAKLDTMKQIRDSTVAQYPAGQWLMEVLDRHSADLAVLAAADKGDLTQTARDLLTQATQIAGQKGVFDDAMVDNALKLLGQVSCKMPPSMNGVGAAGATVLESLRGRTLEDGLKEASKTILPRFKAPPKVAR